MFNEAHLCFLHVGQLYTNFKYTWILKTKVHQRHIIWTQNPTSTSLFALCCLPGRNAMATNFTIFFTKISLGYNLVGTCAHYLYVCNLSKFNLNNITRVDMINMRKRQQTPPWCQLNSTHWFSLNVDKTITPLGRLQLALNQHHTHVQRNSWSNIFKQHEKSPKQIKWKYRT